MNAQRKISEEMLTAYVMNELEGDERQAVEAALRSDPALRSELEATKRFCAGLWEELRKEPLPRLEPKQVEELRRALGATGTAGASDAPRRRFQWWHAALPALAAAAAVGVIIYPRVADRVSVLPTLRQEAGNEAAEVRYVPAAEPEAQSADTPVAATKTEAPAEKKPAQPVLADNKKDLSVAANAAPPPPPATLGGKAKMAAPSKPMAERRGRAGVPATSSKGFAGIASTPTGSVAGGGAYMKMQGAPGQVAAESARMAPADAVGIDYDGMQSEAYDYVQDNPFKAPVQDPLSTFSVDVDTAGYSNLRRFVAGGQMPPKDAVRIEEMLNYFRYDYAAPAADRPFSVNVEVASAPWKPAHRLVRVGLKAQDIEWSQRKPSNLVFLLDVSGSMQPATRLPLVKQSLKLLVDSLGEQDSVAIVVYAGASGLVLPPTSVGDKTRILDALTNLEAGGSTNGGEGIELAYKTAEAAFKKGGINRVILATDGDFNVGTTSQGDLVRLIEKKAKSGVFLTVLGFGMGNYKDSTLEKLADKGNGNYAYVDSIAEARKVLVEEAGGTLVTVAKDVKLQVEFNPEEVSAYRLIGYENRIMAHEDFNNDAKDAGDIGAGHNVTALYEVVPKGVAFKVDGVDPLKYQKTEKAAGGSGTGELMTVKLRYKTPEGSKSSLLEYAVKDKGKSIDDASEDTRFASAVAEIGMLLRESEHKGDAAWAPAIARAEAALGADKGGYRKDFVELARKLQTLSRTKR